MEQLMSEDNKDIGRGNTVSLLHFTQRAHERFLDLIDYYRQLPSSGYSIYQLTDVLTMNDKNINDVKLSDLTIPAKEELTFLESVSKFIGGGCVY